MTTASRESKVMGMSVPDQPSLASLLIEPDYVLVRMALVQEVGLEAAVVLQRIHWRCDVRPQGWTITHEDLAAELRLSVSAVRKATKLLRGRGWLLSIRASTWDPTPVWSLPPLWTSSRDAQNEHHEVPESSTTVMSKTSITSMRESFREEEREHLGRSASQGALSTSQDKTCPLHLLVEPCRGCAADRLVPDELGIVDSQ